MNVPRKALHSKKNGVRAERRFARNYTLLWGFFQLAYDQPI
jgi:hypothetical protein